MSKRVFTVNTTNHMNAAPYQDSEIHQWLVALLSKIASETATDGIHGKQVHVIVEVLDD